MEASSDFLKITIISSQECLFSKFNQFSVKLPEVGTHGMHRTTRKRKAACGDPDDDHIVLDVVSNNKIIMK